MRILPAVPWFMLSPSPVSLIQYAVLTWILWGYLLKAVKYKKHPRILAATDAFFIVAFFVVLTDSFWCLFCVLKWLPLYPQDALQIYSSLGRDLVAAVLFWIFIWDHFKTGVLNFSKSAQFWLIICFVSQALWFWLAPSPAFTDYTFAWRHGFSSEFMLVAFAFSHFIMRVPLWLALLNIRVKLLK